MSINYKLHQPQLLTTLSLERPLPAVPAHEGEEAELCEELTQVTAVDEITGGGCFTTASGCLVVGRT